MATITEDEQRNISTQINLERKRATSFTKRSGEKRRMIPGAVKENGVVTAPTTTCPKCGRAHGERCRFKSGTYCRCNQPSQMICDFPRMATNGEVSTANRPNPKPLA